MLTYNITLDKISTIDEGLRSWVSGTIPVTVATSLFEDDAPHLINLNDTLYIFHNIITIFLAQTILVSMSCVEEIVSDNVVYANFKSMQ